MKRSDSITVCTACVLGIFLGGCSGTGPLSVRFGWEVDQAKLERLPRRSGSVVLLVDPEFWTDKQRISRIPVARRGKSFIIGPGAAKMADQMLSHIFDEVIDVRRLDQISDPQRYDFVIRLVHESFDGRALILPLLSRQRYRVKFGAEVSRPDGTLVGKVAARGSESFWIVSMGEKSPFEGDERLLNKASKTLNAAVQESLFRLMDKLASREAFSEQSP